MGGEAWLGIGLGVAYGAAYVVASLLVVRIASRYDVRRSTLIYLVGMSVRLFVALTLLAATLALVSLHTPAFVSAFLATFVAGLVGEVVWVHRRYGGTS